MLVDTGVARSAARIGAAIRDLGRAPGEVRAILVTHLHRDHTAGQLAGEKGGPEVSLPAQPWPSDQRAVMATFAVTPGTLPTLVAANERLLTVGQPLEVTYHTSGWGGENVELRLWGGDGVTFGGADVSASPLAKQPAPTVDGTMTFPTADLAPGAYAAVLVGENRKSLAYTRFWVKARGAKPTLTTYSRATPRVSPSASCGRTRRPTAGAGSACTRPRRPTPGSTPT